MSRSWPCCHLRQRFHPLLRYHLCLPLTLSRRYRSRPQRRSFPFGHLCSYCLLRPCYQPRWYYRRRPLFRLHSWFRPCRNCRPRSSLRLRSSFRLRSSRRLRSSFRLRRSCCRPRQSSRPHSSFQQGSLFRLRRSSRRNSSCRPNSASRWNLPLPVCLPRFRCRLNRSVPRRALARCHRMNSSPHSLSRQRVLQESTCATFSCFLQSYSRCVTEIESPSTVGSAVIIAVALLTVSIYLH